MAKNKANKKEPQNQDTPKDVNDNEDEEFEDLYPLPPLKGKFYTPNPNARPARQFVRYPY